MAFDGVPRPSQVQYGSDALNPYLAANAAQTERLKKPLVKGPDSHDRVQATHKEHEQYHDGDEENDEGLSQEEQEQILLFAKMRGLLNFSLQEDVRYEFRVNPLTGLIDLVATESGELKLTLTPDELMQMSRKIQRYAGMLADRSG